MAAMKKHASCIKLAALCLVAAAGLLLVPGCTSPPQSKAITPVGFKTPRQHPVSVIVRMERNVGESFDMAGLPELTASTYYEALVTTLKESRTFASVREQPPADYQLSVNLVKTAMSGAFTINQTVSARWQLTQLSDNRVVFDEFISTTGKATTGEALVGVKRLRIALERAGQENIKQGLTRLSELNLNGTPP